MLVSLKGTIIENFISEAELYYYMDILDLKRIGLTEGEIRIYEALLELGETTRTKLAKRSGISPSKIYDVANRLLEKGIISSVKKDGVIHFSAADPERIKDFIQKKEDDLINQKKVVDAILPTLLLKYKKTEEYTDIEVFYGWEGMKTAFDDIAKTLKPGEESCVFGASFGQDPKQANIFFPKYYKKVDKAGYKIRVIFNTNVKNTSKEQVDYFVRSKIHEIRYLYKETFAEINLYRNNVLFVMLLKKPIVIRVKNKDVADAYRTFFNSLWEIAKKS